MVWGPVGNRRFWGPDGPDQTETLSNRRGASRPTDWKRFLSRRGRLGPPKSATPGRPKNHVLKSKFIGFGEGCRPTGSPADAARACCRAQAGWRHRWWRAEGRSPTFSVGLLGGKGPLRPPKSRISGPGLCKSNPKDLWHRCVRSKRRTRPYEFIGFGAMSVDEP